MSTGSNKRVESVYVELDVLLDTRLGTIARISEDAALKTLENGYHSRDTDIFEFVDMQEYRRLYAQRDSLTLSKSMCTNGLQLVKHLVGVLTEQAIARPYHDGVKIVVNRYPYDLTQAELDEMDKAIAAWIQLTTPLEFVSIRPESLTPSYCKSNFAMMLAYEYEAWMNTHAQAFESVRLPEVTMFVPALYNAAKPSAEELIRITKEAAHPFQALEHLASPIIDLKLIDVKYFSVIQSS